MNYVFDHNQEHNGYFDVFSSDESVEWLSIEDAFLNPLSKHYVKFDDIKLPSNEILNYEADNQDYYKSFDYENTPEDALSPDVDIEPLCLFADGNSEAYPALALNHDGGKDAYHIWKNPTTKKASNESGEVFDSTTVSNIKINETRSNPLPNETVNHSEKIDKPLKKTKTTRSSNKKFSSKFKRFRKFGYSRWGRKEDCQMFSLLRQLWKQESVDIEDFWTDHAKISIQHDCILLNLVSQMNWRNDTQSLLKRIQTLAKDQTLSVRQINMLKKLKVKAIEESQEFSLENVIDSFPGKSIATLQSALENIQADFKH